MKQIKRKRILCAVVAVLLLGILAVGLLWQKKQTAIAILTIETPQKVSASLNESLILDVTISDLGAARYPAMSASISFDASRLEFLGLDEGNVFVHDDSNSSGQKLPEWSCNVEQSNANGRINIMYLDMSGGKHAFDKKLLAEEDNVVLRLKFRLRGSVRSGDVCDLIFDDAVFAASDENESLAMTRNTLKVRNSKIVIGE